VATAETAANWNTDGTGGGAGTNASNFTTSGDVFIILSSEAATFGTSTTFASGVTLQMDGTASLSANVVLTINGTITFSNTSTTQLTTGPAASAGIVLSSGATLKSANANGILSTAKSGVTQSINAKKGPRTSLSTAANYEFIGGAQIMTGTPATVNDLTFSGTGAITLLNTLTTVSGKLTMSGTATTATTVGLTISTNLVIGTGTTFSATGFALTVTGTSSITGTLNTATAATGTKTFTGAVTINSGGVWDLSGQNPATSFAGGITMNGTTFNNGTGAAAFSANESLAGANNMTFKGTVTPAGSTTLTNSNTGTVTISSIVLTGNFTHATNGLLSLSAAAPFSGAGTFNASTNTNTNTNTVTYTNASAAVKAGTYSSLTVNGTSTSTAGGAITVNGTFTTAAAATLDMVTNALSVNTVANSGTLKTQNTTGTPITTGKTWGGTVNYNAATGAQTVMAGTYSTLTLGNTSGTSTASGDIATTALNLTSGGIFFGIAANILTINGAITGTGRLKGSSSSNLVIGAAAGTLNFDPTSAATRSLNNLTLNSSASATLGSALDVFGTITVTAATLHLASKNLTLKSNSTNTARLADLNSSTLDGADNVTVERWIPLRSDGTGRAYRLLTSTVNTSGSIKTNLMEGGMNTAVGTNVNPVPLFGTQITGAGGNTNGFDVTQNNASSLYSIANAVTPTYTAVGSTSGTLNALTGYFLYIRGDRSMDMTLPLATGMPTSSTTLRITGTLLTGTKTSFTNALIGGGAFNLITNPYASPIDWSLVQPAFTNVTTSYTLWDPNSGTRGGFVTVNTSGTPSSGAANQYIQSGQVFFVESSGGVPTVSIQETHKASGNNNGVFRMNTAVESFRTELYFTDPNSFRRIADGVIAVYDNSYSAGIDSNDAKEINNWDENIAIAREGKHLAIEARPVILTRDTLPLFMNNMKQQPYEFEFTPSLFTNIGLKAELIDNFTATRTLLSVTATTVVPFTITSNPASSATDRFMVVFGPQTPLAVSDITIRANKNGNGVKVDWTSRTETDMDHYEVERSATGSNFSRKTNVAAIGNSSGPVSYSWFDASPDMGYNFYRIRGIDRAGNFKYSPVVKVLFGKDEPGIVIYPNPVNGNTLELQLTNTDKGTYTVSLFNNLGQRVFSTQVQHSGGSATKTIVLGHTLINGIYQLLLTGGNGVKITERIIKN